MHKEPKKNINVLSKTYGGNPADNLCITSIFIHRNQEFNSYLPLRPKNSKLIMTDVFRAFGVRRYVDWEARWRSGLVGRKIFGVP